MNIEEKYAKLRAAIVDVTGIPDNKGVQLALLAELHKIDEAVADETVLNLLVALIETSD